MIQREVVLRLRKPTAEQIERAKAIVAIKAECVGRSAAQSLRVAANIAPSLTSTPTIV